MNPIYEAELTVPAEQYGNIRPKVKGTVEEIVEAYRAFSEALRPKPVNAIPAKEFNAVLDTYLATKKIPNEDDVWGRMSPPQQEVLQALKRSFARTNK